MIDIYDELIEKARTSGSLIDANLLLLLSVGECDRSLIKRFDRLSAYSELDYDLIARYVSYVGKLITSPNILTEVSNLAGKLRPNILRSFYAALAGKIEILDEQYVESKVASSDQHFMKLGLTDAAIITIALDRKCVVLTDDFALLQVLWHRGAEAINFNHVRQFSGEFN